MQGYNVTSISIDINNSEGNKYGQIKNIKLKVIKEKNTKDENTVYSDNQNFSVQINTVEEVNIGSEKKETRVELRKSEIKEIKKLISEEYDISENCIEVN